MASGTTVAAMSTMPRRYWWSEITSAAEPIERQERPGQRVLFSLGQGTDLV
jgi:hypothetical protein